MFDVIFVGVASTLTSLITASLGLGGGVLLLALLGQILPPIALIPIHGVGQFFSNIGRAYVHRAYLEWDYLRGFFLGSAAGSLLVLPLVSLLGGRFAGLFLGAFILIATWRTQWLKLFRWHPAFSGAITSALSMLFGATGPLVMSVVPNEHWSKQSVVGSHGAAMSFQHGFKTLAFGLIGFELLAYWQIILALLMGAVAGNILGQRVLSKISDQRFRVVLKWVLTLLAMRMVVLASWDLWGA